MATFNLETPDAFGDLYLASDYQEAEEFSHRPIFTGDVIRRNDDSFVALLQHPCAMRRGVNLAPKLLVAQVVPFPHMPSDWSHSHFKRMFLPRTEGSSYAINFDDIEVLPRVEIEQGVRFLIMSELGVNTLLQRWLHHNSRVIVPTVTLHEVTTGPFDEADLVGEAVADLVERDMDPITALALADTWLSGRHTEDGQIRRELLAIPQSRGVIRGAMRRYIKEEVDKIPA